MELGSIFFHSTPVRPGAGGLGVTFKDDMDLRNCKITDLLIHDLKRTHIREVSRPTTTKEPVEEDITEDLCLSGEWTSLLFEANYFQ